MRGILINPYDRTIKMTLVKKKDIDSIYEAMSWPTHEVRMIEVGMIFPNNDNLVVDEEGLLTGGHKVWKLNGTPFVGCGLLLGIDPREADWTHVKTSIADINMYVRWTDLVSKGMI